MCPAISALVHGFTEYLRNVGTLLISNMCQTDNPGCSPPHIGRCNSPFVRIVIAADEIAHTRGVNGMDAPPSTASMWQSGGVSQPLKPSRSVYYEDYNGWP